MATTEEELRKKLKSSTAERVGRSVRAGVDTLGGAISTAGKAVANTVGGVGTGIGTAASLAGNELQESVVTPLGDFARGFTGSTPSPVVESPNQRNQAAAGTAGTTLGDSSGTGANTVQNPNSPVLGFENTRTVDPSANFIGAANRGLSQRNADRGFNTQTSQFGATAGDGTQLASRGGTFSAVGSSRTPQAQLAALRETFGSSGGRSTTGGGVAFAPNSAARERNARLNDPSNRLLSDLQSQVRRGQISARAAGDIAATLLGQRQSATTARERIAAQAAQTGEELAFKRQQLASEDALGRAKLATAGAEGALDRATKLQIAEQKAVQDAEKLGLDRQTFSELQRRNLAQEQLGQQRLGLQGAIAEARLGQEAQLQGQKTATARLGDSVNVLKGLAEGSIQPDQAAGILTEMFGPKTASKLLGGFGADLFTTEE